MPLEVLLSYGIVSALLGNLFSHMTLRIVLSRSVKSCVGILMETVLNLWIDLGKVAIFTVIRTDP